MMSFLIRRLGESDRARVAAHLFALPATDRYLRFSFSAPPAAIARYVDGIDFARDAVLGVDDLEAGIDGRGALAGIAHAAFENDLAEFGVSVLPAHRGRGLGSALLERSVAFARGRGMRRLWMQFLSQNAPIIRMARKLGMRIVLRGIHSCAQLDLSGRQGSDTNETNRALC